MSYSRELYLGRGAAAIANNKFGDSASVRVRVSKSHGSHHDRGVAVIRGTAEQVRGHSREMRGAGGPGEDVQDKPGLERDERRQRR